MKRSVVSGLSCSALVVCIAAVLGACSSSDATTDSSAVDVGKGDIVTADVPAGADACGPNVPCEETCLDAKAKEAPITAWTGAWGMGVGPTCNATLESHLTTDARRCQWRSLNDTCAMYNCLSTEWTGTAAVMKGLSAGKVTIGNGSGEDVVLLPDSDGVYEIKSWNTLRWNAGDTITYTAEGATIPAFTLTIGFPTPVVASDPVVPDAGAKPAVDRSTPMTFAWTPTDEKVIVTFLQRPFGISMLDRQELWCIFDGAAGTGTVPAAVLQHLKLGMGYTGYGIGHYNRRCYNIGGFHIQAAGASGPWWDATLK